MKPVVSVEEMTRADAAAQAEVGIDTLIARAGFAVFVRALQMVGGAYGRDVVVLAGKGHNGDDGRVAAKLLSQRGARVHIVEASADEPELSVCDLVIDAAYGTGFRGSYVAPRVRAPSLVLAVDLPSGLDATTGIANPGVLRADSTVTFQALKSGLLTQSGPELCGSLTVADLEIELPEVHMHVVEDEDTRRWLTPRPRHGHKWDSAVLVIAGSPGMYGSVTFAASAAQRGGAGMVRLLSPGVELGVIPVLEAVARPVDATDWQDVALAEGERCAAALVGPGLGLGPKTKEAIRRFIQACERPLLIDADGLSALGSLSEAQSLLHKRTAPTVLTPHDGEFTRITGQNIGDDRVQATRDLAQSLQVVVLLKGSPTIVAAPDGEVLIATSPSAKLSTAGTGDVLSGLIAAFLARGCDPLRAAALGAHVHGQAANLCPNVLVASDLPLAIARWLERHAPVVEYEDA